MNEQIWPDLDAATLTAVEVIGDYSVRVTFSDGVEYDADMTRWFVEPGGKPIGTPAEFALVKLDIATDTLVWPADALFHVHGESLHDLAKGK